MGIVHIKMMHFHNLTRFLSLFFSRIDNIPGPDEYFYKKHHHTPLSATSATSSIGSNELRIGGTEEFDQMRHNFHQKRRD